VVAAFCAGVASAAFVLPFWVRPFLFAVQKGNPADWIGFAGNFGAGAMTLIAAITAWFAVQRQVAAQDRIAAIQTAIQKSESLNGQIAALESDRVLFWRASQQALWSLIPQNQFREIHPSISINYVTSARDQYAQRQQEIEKLIVEINEASIRQWRFPKSVAFRHALIKALIQLKLAVNQADLFVKVTAIQNSHLNGTIEPLAGTVQDECLKIDITPAQEAVVAAVHSFDKVAIVEIQRLVALLAASQANAGL
jgi:hypothetical protein